MRLIGPQGTPALFSLAIKSPLDCFLVTSEMIWLMPPDFWSGPRFRRSGDREQIVEPSVWQKRVKYARRRRRY